MRRYRDASRPRHFAKGDIVLVEAGDFIPVDGEVDRRRRLGRRIRHHRRIARRSSAKAAATARSVTGGTRVLSDWLVVRIGANPGETFLDRMITMVEGAKRQKTPNEIALEHPARRR